MSATVLSTAATGPPLPPSSPTSSQEAGRQAISAETAEKTKGKAGQEGEGQGRGTSQERGCHGADPQEPQAGPSPPPPVRSKLPKFRKLARGTAQAQAIWKYLRNGDK
ncbi:hypothetical protein N7519_003173 [Penicillium mononematosum]|uniref:uncharacterized protein n=1 Tax=Penicillium mononematosum TaxID=268346 RepID=UPI0025472FD3|nr:uncharacterized protein N7519_003173 [Penicillium mononematosum]KAJ6188265.1 hypothetical protein N7519_003173 [Penicillium mononematosum]